MKKFIFLLVLIFGTVTLASCSSKNVLVVLNWGEYINEDLVVQFEEKYNVRVVLNLASSSELMEQRIKSGTTCYDIVIPSDYIIDKLYRQGYLQQIDLSKLTNYNADTFLPGLQDIQGEMFENNESYAIPYFWGTFGLVYNRKIEDYVKQYGWATIYEADKTPKGTRVGMYNVPRLAYAAAMMYKDPTGIRYNTATPDDYQLFESVLQQREFYAWGTDELKKLISSDNLDLAFMYTGDFFDVYNLRQAEGLSMDHMNIYIPELTISFFDGMIIPKNAQHVDLAHKFIDFFLDPEVAFENASIVGYCTPIAATYEMMKQAEDWQDKINNYPYYPHSTALNPFTAKPLKDLGSVAVARLSTIINNVKAG